MRFILNKKIIILLVSIVIVSSFTRIVFSAWNGTFYNPGDTLNPECSPEDTDCNVRSPLTISNISNTAYDATTWDGVTTIAPSKDAIRDKIESLSLGGSDVWTTSGNNIYYTTGNVGIGTTSPGEMFSIANGNIILDNNYYLKFKNATGTANPVLSANTSNATVLSAVGNGGILFSGSGGTAYLKIDNSTGNVGIGTTSPSANLEVVGNLIARYKASPIHPTDVNGYVELYVYDNVGTKVGRILPYNGASYLDLAIGDWNGGNPNIMLKTGGNVGIGTGSPSNRLSVVGNFDVTGNVGIGTTSPESKLEIRNDTPVLTISDTANNTTQNATQATLYFNGRWYASTADPSADTFSDAAIKLFHDNATGNGGSGLSFWTSLPSNGGLSEKMRITKDGNIGIGTTSPTSLLHVTKSSTGTTNVFAFENTDNTNTSSNARLKILSGGSSGGNPILQWTVSGVTDWYVNIDNSDSDKFKIGTSISDSKLVIDTSGNVGIGTTSPVNKLDVAGDVALTGDLKFDDTGYLSTQGTRRIIFGGSYFGPATNNDRDLGYSSLKWKNLWIGSNAYIDGNVGIGTTSPGYPLEVRSDSFPGGIISLFKTTNNGDTAFQVQNSVAAWQFSVRESGDANPGGFNFYYSPDGSTNWVNAMNLTTSGSVSIPVGNLTVSGSGDNSFSGKVGIGKTNPSYPLDVAGDISLTGTFRGVDVLASNSVRTVYLSGPSATNATLASKNNIRITSNADDSGSDGVILIGQGGYAAPTTEYARFDNNGYLGIGTTTPGALLNVNGKGLFGTDVLPGSASANSRLVVARDGGNVGGSFIGSVSGFPFLEFNRSRGTISVPTTVADGDQLGAFLAGGYDGDSTKWTTGIEWFVDGTVSSNVVPTKMVFSTGTGATRNTRMTIRSDGKVGVGISTPNNLLQVLDLINFDNTDFNTKLGYTAGKNIVTGAQYNTFVGYETGLSSVASSTDVADYNSAFGYQAFNKNTIGAWNVAMGYQSLFNNTSGNRNSSVGWGSLYTNTSGYRNVAMGNSALYLNNSGNRNTAIGDESAYKNTTGSYNTAIGNYALYLNSTGTNNVAIGYNAGSYETGSNAFYVDAYDRTNTAGDKAGALLYGLFDATPANQILTVNAKLGIGTISPGAKLDISAGNFDIDNTTNANQFGVITKNGTRFIHDFNYGNNNTVTTEGYNTFVGLSAGNLTMGSTATEIYHASYNSVLGNSALTSNTTGYYNSAVGVYTLNSNTSGYDNSAVGYSALRTNNTGYQNAALGMDALRGNTTGYNNSAVGFQAMLSNADGYSNSAVGMRALYANTTGYSNVAIGLSSGRYIADGSANETANNSIYLGSSTRASVAGGTNEIVIGANAIGAGSNSVVLGSDSITKTLLKGSTGIGTASPLKTLDVAGSGRFTGTASSTLTGTADPTASTTLVGTNTLFNTELVVGDRITINSETRTVTAIASNTSLTVDTAFTNTPSASITKLPAVFIARISDNTPKFVVNDLGNVGVWVTSPNALLEVGSNSYTATSSGIAAFVGAAGTGINNLDLIIKNTSANSLARTDRILFQHGSSLTGGYITSGREDLYNDAASADSNLQFATSLNGSNNERMRITSTGLVGVGNNSPEYLLHVGSSSVTDATVLLRLQDADSTCDFTANSGAPACGSDISLKKNIINLSGNLEKVVALRPVTYNWLTDEDGVNIKHGFIAQEVAEIMPELVTNGIWIDGSTKKFLQTEGMIPYIIGAIKELNLGLTMSDVPLFEIINGVEAKTFTGKFFDKLIAWMANAENKITRIFTGEVCLTEAGEETVCINRAELKNLKALLNQVTPSSQAIPQTEDIEKPVEEKPTEEEPAVEQPVIETPVEIPVETSGENQTETPAGNQIETPAETITVGENQ